MSSRRSLPPPRSSYKYWRLLTTRWSDNDIYGHVNNAAYYTYIDSVVNAYLLEERVLGISQGSIVGLVVESHCEFFDAIAYPCLVELGLRVQNIGRTSVLYDVGIFAEDQEQVSAVGGFTHVFVDRATRKPVTIPLQARSSLKKLLE
ncbi:MAG: thioesterase [Acidiferrobacteraceae bacterium]|nr:thioesterase [Acidiferrobacteraceae bacterium]